MENSNNQRPDLIVANEFPTLYKFNENLLKTDQQKTRTKLTASDANILINLV